MKKLTLIIALISVFGCKPSKEVEQKVVNQNNLEGTWELEFITAPGKTVADLFPHKLPTLTYDQANKKVFGNDGCNQYNGTAELKDNKVLFEKDKFISTKMACHETSDHLYIEELFKINAYALSADGKHLTLLTHDIATMRFGKKQE